MVTGFSAAARLRFCVAFLLMILPVYVDGQTAAQPWNIAAQWFASPSQLPANPVAVDQNGNLVAMDILPSASGVTFHFYKFTSSGTQIFNAQIPGISEVSLIAADSVGNILIAGAAPVSGGLPVTPGAYTSSPYMGPTFNPNSPFACKLSGADGTLIFAPT